MGEGPDQQKQLGLITAGGLGGSEGAGGDGLIGRGAGRGQSCREGHAEP